MFVVWVHNQCPFTGGVIASGNSSHIQHCYTIVYLGILCTVTMCSTNIFAAIFDVSPVFSFGTISDLFGYILNENMVKTEDAVKMDEMTKWVSIYLLN